MGTTTLDNRWSIERLRVDASLVGTSASLAPKRRGRVKGYFIRGPVPWAWLQAAREQGIAALYVGNALWCLCGQNKNALTFPVSNVKLRELGIDRYSKRRGLGALEAASLIAVERRGKKSPLVTLLCVDGQSVGTRDGG